ncbi:MAG: nicotinate-nucleotide--dimethylbenzimidazole phosphoribosyltransferase [Gammaproteobacteria bacterium]|nr:nicotinate-nucleotide--dimethylbenzimidazole phosphoribosyltransferase [Gammaproteobacteria bacterium]
MTNTMDWLNVPAVVPHEARRREAEARQQILTKPPGALGRLEAMAIQLAALQDTAQPSVERVHIAVFAGDHGVAVEGVSAFPQAVTGEMVRNFSRGGAAISVLAHALNATLEVINLGTVNNPGPLDGVMEYRLGPGTANFTQAPAMDEHQLACALAAGRHAAERARLAGAQLFIGGEMGIANTTAATALACALLGLAPDHLVGPGTGLDAAGVARKSKVIQRALDLHNAHLGSPIAALRRVGGFEIAALAGSYIACAQMGIPVLVDGFISSSAALAAVRLRPGAENWLLFSHASAEPGHRLMLEALGAQPLLSLGMRLGEGSGAATAVPILRMACALHNEMATFAEAAVSDATGASRAVGASPEGTPVTPAHPHGALEKIS